MLHERILMCKVLLQVANIGKDGVILTSDVVNKLLKQLSNIRASSDIGYFVAITRMISIGRGDNTLNPRFIAFPVEFCCRTLMPLAGEVMTGVVCSMIRMGVLLRSGPMNMIYLSSTKMPGYLYQEEDNPLFLRDDMSRIEEGVVVRFCVLDVRWAGNIRRDLSVLATIDGDGLGPVSHNGMDNLEV